MFSIGASKVFKEKETRLREDRLIGFTLLRDGSKANGHTDGRTDPQMERSILKVTQWTHLISKITSGELTSHSFDSGSEERLMRNEVREGIHQVVVVIFDIVFPITATHVVATENPMEILIR